MATSSSHPLDTPLQRRSLLRAAAWAAPIAIMATAAPALAASPDDDFSTVHLYAHGANEIRDSASGRQWVIDLSPNYDSHLFEGGTIPAGTVTITVTFADCDVVDRDSTSSHGDTSFPWTMSITDRTVSFTNATDWPRNWQTRTDDITVHLHCTADIQFQYPPVISVTPDSIQKMGSGWGFTRSEGS